MKIATLRKQSQRLCNLEGKCCSICKSTDNIQRHHVKLKPEEIILVCQGCHTKIHMKDGSWGKGKGLKKTRLKPVPTPRPL